MTTNLLDYPPERSIDSARPGYDPAAAIIASKANLAALAQEVDDICTERGFYAPPSVSAQPVTEIVLTEAAAAVAKIGQIHGEIDELLAVTSPGELPEEFADVAIRVLHLAGAGSLDLDAILCSQPPRPFGIVWTIKDAVVILHEQASKIGNAARRSQQHAFEVELAYLWAAVVRCSYSFGIDLIPAIRAKMEKNAARPRLHGHTSQL